MKPSPGTDEFVTYASLESLGKLKRKTGLAAILVTWNSAVTIFRVTLIDERSS